MKKINYFILLLFVQLISCTDQMQVLEPTAPIQKSNTIDIVYVDNINKSIAKSAAVNFLTNIDKKIVLDVRTVDSVVDWEGQTSMYIVNLNPKGYVITSANVKNDPIITYSFDNNFTFPEEDGDIPDALTNILAEVIIVNKWMLRDDINLPDSVTQSNTNNWFRLLDANNIFNDGFKLNPDIRHWDPCADTPDVLIDQKAIVYGNYCKTSWGQDIPYNYYVPNNYPVGCVAVAVGQIMKFHEHPKTFNWSIMPDICINSYNNMTAGEHEVALILSDIGLKVGMNYRASGSSASSSHALNALVNHYQYSNIAKLDKYNYNAVVNEIKTKNHPIYVDGCGTMYSWRWWLFGWWTYREYDDCHAFIIDGYQEIENVYYNVCSKKTSTKVTKFMHYNYGWGATYNNWFSTYIRDVVDTYEDIDVIKNTTFYNFKYRQNTIYNLNP